MELGDFTNLAKDYINRVGYSHTVLSVIKDYIEKLNGKIICVADVGAGTGKLTLDLEAIGCRGFAVEPNDAMREEGIKAFVGRDSFSWSKGFAEYTELPDNSVDWVLMGSSFHWTNPSVALREFHRILKPYGFFTAIWNPRNIESSQLHLDIENSIKEMIPNLRRNSSGSRSNMKGMELKLLSTEYFSDMFLVEAPYNVDMTKDRYMGAWRSVNDIQVQAGEKKFKEVLQMIESKISDLDLISVPYLSRAFTVRSTKK